MLSVLLVVVLLILINALYVAAEFAAVGARRSRIRQLSGEGNLFAVRLLPILEDPQRLDRYIAACQIGITISSLVLGAFGQATLAVRLTPLFAGWGGMQAIAAQSTAALVVLVGLTVAQMVLGELVPKSVALQYPNRTALYTVLPLAWTLKLLSWFIKVLNGSGLLILKLLGVPAAGHQHIHSPEEIDLLIAESRDGGLLEPDEHQRLRRALRLGLRPVHQLMVPRTRIAALDIATPLPAALRQVADSPYTRLPLYRGSIDNVVGLLHTKDLVLRYVEDENFTALEQIMRPLVVIPESAPTNSLLELLRERRSHQALVVDEYGGVAGLVTLEDILAEVMGDIADEFKTYGRQPERLPDGRVRLPGDLRLDEAEPWSGALWEGSADTIGGHVMAALGHIPTAGERVTIAGIEVEVESVAQRAITSLLVTPARGAAAEGERHG